jgi:hypothetical protein
LAYTATYNLGPVSHGTERRKSIPFLPDPNLLELKNLSRDLPVDEQVCPHVEFSSEQRKMLFKQGKSTK